MVMRKLPVGLQDFEKLRKRGCGHIDKDESVPKRFGPLILRATEKNGDPVAGLFKRFYAALKNQKEEVCQHAH